MRARSSGGTPAPLSATSSCQLSSCARACRWIAPPFGEYLIAFDSRFSRIRRSLPRSASSTRSSILTSRRTRCESSVSCWFSSTCLMSGRRRNSLISSVALWLCQALNDSRFSISRCSLMPLSRRIAVTSRCPLPSSPTAPSISSSVPSRMLASGVFSSCDMWRRKRLRSCARSSRRWRSHSSWWPRRSRSRGPETAIGCVKAPRPSSLIARSIWRSGRPIDSVSARIAISDSGTSSELCT